MRNYSLDALKKIIARYPTVTRISLGMYEDWWWTAQEVYTLSTGLTWNGTDALGGIKGSTWATPAAMVELADGNTLMLPCYVQQGEQEERNGRAALGCLSGPAQDALPPLESA
jgi:hypothetical protein